MGQVVITIDKREYAITCDDGQEGHILKLSRVLNEKASLLAKSLGPINENMMLAMVGLLLADDMEEMQKNGGGISAESVRQQDAELAKSIDAAEEKIKTLIQDIKSL